MVWSVARSSETLLSHHEILYDSKVSIKERTPGKPVAIVTGGTTGLGAAITKLLVEREYRVLMVALSDPNDFASHLQSHGYEARFMAADLRNSEVAARNIVLHAHSLWERIDLLVNCAATISHKEVDEVTDLDWNEIFAVNLKAPFFLCQQALPQLELTSGCIVNVSSMNSINPAKKNQLYDSLKAALNNLTQGLALDFRERGVRVNAILPGGIHTPLVEEWLEKYHNRPPVASDFTSPAIATAERVAQGVIALASEELSWVNGVLLPIDGGYGLG